MFCPECGFKQPEDHRFCVACGRLLPSNAESAASKTTQLFLGFPTQSTDPREAVLRVSRYGDGMLPQTDGSTRLVRRHTRISIWEVDRARSAISLGAEESDRLRRFLGQEPSAGTARDLPWLEGTG